MVKSFCISLEKNKDKWPELQHYFAENDLNDFEIFDAVKGNSVKDFVNTGETSDTRVKQIILEKGGVEKLLSIGALYHLLKQTKRREHFQLGSWGAVGCSLSHLGIWEMIVKQKIDKVCIFEDDVYFKENFKDKFPLILENFPEDADVVFLDVSRNFSPQKYNDYFDLVQGQFFGTHGYIITNRGAQRMLEHAFPIEFQIDGFMSFMNVVKKLRFYTATNMCTQKLHLSSIQVACELCDVKDSDVNLFRRVIIALMLLLIFYFCFKLIKPAIVSQSKSN